MFNGIHDVSIRKEGAVKTYWMHYDELKENLGFYTDPKCPVKEISQGHWEFPVLIDIYRNFAKKPLTVVELGSLFGGSLWHWIQYAPAGSLIISVDLLLPESHPDYKYQKQCHELWYQWAKEKSVNLEVITDNSQNQAVIQRVKEKGPIDFLFIDANHGYEGVKADFCSYGDLVRSGGIIALHDIVFASSYISIEVHKLWKEIREASYVIQELYAAPDQIYHNGAGLGIGVVYI